MVPANWWFTYNKQTLHDKLKSLKLLLTTMIADQPSIREEDESVGASRAAVVGLTNDIDETKVDANEEDDGAQPTFQLAQQRSSVGGKAPRSHFDNDDETIKAGSEGDDMSEDVDIVIVEEPKKINKFVQSNLKEKLTQVESKKVKNVASTSSSSPTTGKKVKFFKFLLPMKM